MSLYPTGSTSVLTRDRVILSCRITSVNLQLTQRYGVHPILQPIAYLGHEPGAAPHSRKVSLVPEVVFLGSQLQ